MKATLLLTTGISIATIVTVGIHQHSLILILVLVGLVGTVFLSNWNKDKDHSTVIASIAILTLLTALLGR